MKKRKREKPVGTSNKDAPEPARTRIVNPACDCDSFGDGTPQSFSRYSGKLTPVKNSRGSAGFALTKYSESPRNRKNGPDLNSNDIERGFSESEESGGKSSVCSANSSAPLNAEEIVSQLKSDFEKRAKARRPLEAQWRLNVLFYQGKQHFFVNSLSEIQEDLPAHEWQEKQVFNHISAIVETRLAKLARVRPALCVRPASADQDDLRTARAANKILASVSSRLELDAIIRRGSLWSELCGSVFYKVLWDGTAGRRAGQLDGRQVFEGDVRVDVCPPCEIYPEDLNLESVEEQRSVIHAKAFKISEIEQAYGIRVKPERVELFAESLGGERWITGGEEDSAVLIERYTRPCPDKPQGELVVAAGGTLLHLGPLPSPVGERFSPSLPFVKQDALTKAGSFFGTSMVERCIPIQRAFNAVKNRKHEFMNRIAAGVLAVEDGSVDASLLEAEGLMPGKVLTYRQGSAPPRLLDPGGVPAEFTIEEDRLLSEFISVSGVSELMRSSAVPSSITSGVALQLLIEQDDTRLSISAESVRQAARTVGKYILRFYKRYAAGSRIFRTVGADGAVEAEAFSGSDVTSDDVVPETANELDTSPAQRRATLFDLLKTGLFHEKDGTLSEVTRAKLLSALGCGGFEQATDLSALNINRAGEENALMAVGKKCEPREYDDHKLHEAEHIKFLLSGEFAKLKDKASAEKLAQSHIRAHKTLLRLSLEAEGSEV